MRLLGNFLMIATLATPAFALDQDIVNKMIDSARGIERDASLVSQSLKTKKVDAGVVQEKISAMSSDVGALMALVAEVEAQGMHMSDRDRADWKLIRDKVQLLEIFHTQKQKLAFEDIAKHRSLIRAHADGLVFRAQKLQQTAVKLQRAPVS
jgi:hypothetical protein